MIKSAAIERRLSGAEVEHFQQYGFVRLKKILEAEQVAALRNAFSFALDTWETSPSACDMTRVAERGADELGPAALFCAGDFTQVADRAAKPYLNEDVPTQRPRGHFRLDASAWRRVEALRGFALHGAAPQLAAGLLGARAVRFYDDQLVIKEAGTRERTAFHQDLSYLHVGGDCGVVLTVFLDRARQGLGSIGFVPGSHRWGQAFKPNYMISDLVCPGSEGVELPQIEASPESFGVQFIDSDPGDVLAHHVLTLTGQEGNRGKADCRVLSFAYVDAALKHKRRRGVAVPPLHNAATRDGAELDPNAHPIVWPLVKSEALAG